MQLEDSCRRSLSRVPGGRNHAGSVTQYRIGASQELDRLATLALGFVMRVNSPAESSKAFRLQIS
jgi:hypothetical protein